MAASPKLVGFYGRDKDHRFLGDLSRVKYMVVNPRDLKDLDVSVAEDSAVTYEHADEDSAFWQYLRRHIGLIQESPAVSVEDVPFVTSRNTIEAIFGTKYTPYHEEWNATLLAGVVYLMRQSSPVVKSVSSRWSHKFFQYLLVDRPDDRPDPLRPMVEADRFFGVFRMKLQSNRVLYKCIIDGISAREDSDDPGDLKPLEGGSEKDMLRQLRGRKFVKIASTTIPESTTKFWTSKTRDVWQSAFLSRAERVYVGFRQDNVVTGVKQYDMSQLERIKCNWSRRECLESLEHALNYIKKCFKEELASLKYTGGVREAPVVSLKFVKRNGRIVQDVRKGKFSGPEWYMEEIRKIS